MAGRFYVMAVALLLGVIVLNGCRSSANFTPTSNKLQIVVSIPPQKYFVERIGDDHITVNVMLPSGAEPHTFEPKPEQLKALSKADAYLRIRIDFEDAWMDKFMATNSRMLVVDTTEGIQRRPIAPSSQAQSWLNDTQEKLDPHIWLSPTLVKVQAQTIYRALVKLDAKHQEDYQTNLNRFLTDLDALDGEIRQTLTGVKNRKFIVFHPSWGYFAQDYQLEQVPIEVGGQEPSAAELAKLITTTKQEQIKIIFAEPQFSQQSAAAIAKEIGGTVLLIDPLSPDWMKNMQEVTNTFARVLSQRGDNDQSAFSYFNHP